MNSFATGLTVRFFKVMIPTGQGGMGSLSCETGCSANPWLQRYYISAEEAAARATTPNDFARAWELWKKKVLER